MNKKKKRRILLWNILLTSVVIDNAYMTNVDDIGRTVFFFLINYRIGTVMEDNYCIL